MSTETLHKETREVILRNIESKDRRYRVFQGTFVVLVFLALISLLWLQEITLNNVKTELKTQQDTVAQINKNTTASLDKINRHLDCIVLYFGQKNRATLTIQDINKCTLQTSSGSVQQFFNQPSSSSGTPGSTNSGVTPSSSPQATAPSSSVQPAASSNGSGGGSTPTPQPASPLTVLGIPACVPLTGVCVTQ